ncbi:unnamed protein product [Phaedon cochleariae]|uniref:Trissin n=1 Tax=Phaedon cochleariae TaxID=80249 RepID=A0A9P0DSZ4_PHACE|nr:unnamed protein product [Phaedon cochleariae]
MVTTKMRELTLLAFLFILGVVWSEAQSCNSCGSECTSACGTRHFRTCCFNYLKKRSDPLYAPFVAPPMDPSLRLELWLAKSGYPLLQRGGLADRPLDGAQIRMMTDEENKGRADV